VVVRKANRKKCSAEKRERYVAPSGFPITPHKRPHFGGETNAACAYPEIRKFFGITFPFGNATLPKTFNSQLPPAKKNSDGWCGSTRAKTCDLILIVGHILRQKGSELQEVCGEVEEHSYSVFVRTLKTV
jgi:hypothetical protein